MSQPISGTLLRKWAYPHPALSKKGPAMNRPNVEPSKAEVVLIKGFEGEDIEVSVEQLEPRIVPQSSAGFLD
jgi:hypothetical protein